MKSLLRGDRAPSAAPVSLAARVHAWAKESLAARGFAVGAGLVVLAVIGRSALAGGPLGASTPPAVASATVTSGAAPMAVQAVIAVDAGVLATQPAFVGAGAVAAIPTVAVDELPATSAPAQSSGGAGAKPRASPDDPVDLNTATLDDLRRLPGVGAKRAEAILALRAHLPGGRFKQIEDLLKVKGVGRAMLRRLHPLVRLTF
jgi:competence protein ComEA